MVGLFMDEELLFRFLLVAIYAVFTVIRMRYRVESITQDPEQRYNQRTKAMIFMMIAILGSLISLVMWIMAFPWILLFQAPFPSWIRWLGVIGGVCSLPLVLWIHRTLGRQYSAELAIQQDHKIVKTGPYSRTSHPMYTMLNVFSLSIAMISSNILVLFLFILVVVPFPWVARMEEQMMIDQFGD